MLSQLPKAVIDAEGYAVCPDCGTRIKCVGQLGLRATKNGTKGLATC